MPIVYHIVVNKYSQQKELCLTDTKLKTEFSPWKTDSPCKTDEVRCLLKKVQNIKLNYLDYIILDLIESELQNY